MDQRQRKKLLTLRAQRMVYCSQVLFLKKPAENYYVREWANIKLVGAHDNFSAGYPLGLTIRNIREDTFNNHTGS